MFVIKRTDRGCPYVAVSSSTGSYTFKLQEARVFTNREEAEANRCPENEVVVLLCRELSIGRSEQ